MVNFSPSDVAPGALTRTRGFAMSGPTIGPSNMIKY
jgi:hypothetical protein